jgi:hypothetical protein
MVGYLSAAERAHAAEGRNAVAAPAIAIALLQPRKLRLSSVDRTIALCSIISLLMPMPLLLP